MRGNTTRIALEKGRMAYAEDMLYQYDYGQRLIIDGVDLPAAYEVHFSNGEFGESKTSIGNDTGVDIPDEYLETGKPVRVWLFLHDGADDGETEYSGYINVIKRAKPTNAEPTPVQQDVITQTIAALDAAVDEAEAIAEAIPGTVNAALEEAKESGMFDGFSPIANVVKSGEKSTITITDKEGTTTAEVDDGYSPSASVTKSGTKSVITITDKGGTTTAEVTDGQDGHSPVIAGSKSGKTSTITSDGVTIATILDGEDGQDGYSPSASVSKVDGTATITVTDKTGTTTAEVSDGDDGFSPSASVSKSGSTATITITDKNGTTTAEVTDGQDGATGATPVISIGTVSKLSPGSNPTASMDTTDPEHPVLSLGLVTGDPGDPTLLIDDTSTALDKTWSSSKVSSDLAPKANPVFTGSISMGRKAGTTVGEESVAVGHDATASERASHAEGGYTTASGEASHAEGGNTTASGALSHAEGGNTTASESYSHAEGFTTTASGVISHAEGNQTVASGITSHSEGNYTVAAGADSHVGGRLNTVDSYDNWTEWTANTAYVVGDKRKVTTTSNDVTTITGYICNTAHTSGSSFDASKWTNQYGKMNYAEIIGNGTAIDARSNARALDWDGNERLMGDVYVGCNSDSTGGTKLAKVTDIPDPTSIIDDTAGDGDTNKTWSADKLTDLNTAIESNASDITDLQKSKAPVILDTASGAIASFPDGADGLPIESLVVGIEPVQSGTGDPSPENVRPISGWTGCNVSRTGVNLYPIAIGTEILVDNGNATHSNNNGSLVINTDATSSSSGVYLKNNATMQGVLNSLAGLNITISFDVVASTTGNLRVVLCGTNTVFEITTTKGRISHSALVGSTKNFNLYGVNSGATFTISNFQIEIGSSASTYEAYQCNTYPISWQTEAGTVYGGNLDVTTGVLTVDRAMSTVVSDNLTNNGKDTTNNIYRAFYRVTDRKYPADVFSNIFNTTGDITVPWFMSVRTANNGVEFEIPFSAINVSADDDANSVMLPASKTWFSNNSVQLCYYLDEPQTYQLTPTQINSLLGLNHIFADCGDSDVTYRADTELFVQKSLPTVPVQDVQVNGVSVLSQGVANIPRGSNSNYGVTLNAASSHIKSGDGIYYHISPTRQHESTFYGLAKAAGADMASLSGVTVGVYPEAQKSAISQMLDAPETVSGSTPSITAKPGVRYVCGECATLTIVVPSTGIIDVTFESGSTPTVLTVTPPTGMTMRWIGEDPSALEANKTYEVNIKDGCLGMVVSWT